MEHARASLIAAVPAHLSPSLRGGKGAGAAAYEVKFLVPDDLAWRVEDRLARHLTLDPHADPARDNGYQTTTLYCDTPALDVLNRVGSHGRRKLRVRRYGLLPTVFLERKTKAGRKVRKHRATVAIPELAALDGAVVPEEWPGHWFHRHLTVRDLAPTGIVTYDRTAYGGETADGPLRLTFDRRLRGRRQETWDVSPVAAGSDLLDGQVVMEFKFMATLPTIARKVMEEFGLESSGASKYRRLMVGATGNA